MQANLRAILSKTMRIHVHLFTTRLIIHGVTPHPFPSFQKITVYFRENRRGALIDPCNIVWEPSGDRPVKTTHAGRFATPSWESNDVSNTDAGQRPYD